MTYIAKQTIRCKGARREFIGKGNTKSVAIGELMKQRRDYVGNNSFNPGPMTVEEE